jgi:hypothetical protein
MKADTTRKLLLIAASSLVITACGILLIIRHAGQRIDRFASITNERYPLCGVGLMGWNGDLGVVVHRSRSGLVTWAVYPWGAIRETAKPLKAAVIWR